MVTARYGARSAPLLASTSLVQPFRPWILLAVLLAISGFLLLQNLNSPFITLWDESIQANIVKNLASDPRVPRLHSSPTVASLPGDPQVPDSALASGARQSPDVGTDYRDWTNNTIWLHKPLLPFYISAGLYRLLGQSVLSLRLSGAIFAWLTALLLFLIGHRFFNSLTGLAAAAIFILPPYTMQLVHGTEFAGFPDLALTFFLSIALYLLLQWNRTGSTAALCWMGLFIGLAWMCKGGLALAPFVVLLLLAALKRQTGNIPPVLLSLAIFGLVILPYKLYWSAHFPLQSGYEGHQQLSHLRIPVEGHSGSLGTYLLFFLPGMLAWALAPLAYFSLIWPLFRSKPSKPAWILALWSLVYLLPLSFAASKVENFIFPVLPAIALLIPEVLRHLIGSRRFALVLSLCVSSLATWLTFRLTQSMHSQAHWHPDAILSLFIMVASFALAWFVLARIKSPIARPAILGLAATFVAVFCIFAVEDFIQNLATPVDAPAQASIRRSGLALRSIVNPGALILMHTQDLSLGYLYLMYWSGNDTLDLCRDPHSSITASLLKNEPDVYLLTRGSLPGRPVAALPAGNLYPVRAVSPQLWVPLAINGCATPHPGT